MAVHAGCVNGHLVLDEYTSAECPNLKLQRRIELIRKRLPPEVRDVVAVHSSPLYTPKRKGEDHPSVDLTKRNLFISGIPWNSFLPHLKFVMICKPMTVKIVDDLRLKEVFVGSEAYKSRPASVREAKETNNAIVDLVGEEYDLVIIRIGLLGHKNVAAANVLREALMIRHERMAKPTWIFQSSDPRIMWTHSRDEEVEAYVRDKFEALEMTHTGPALEPVQDVGIDVEGDETVPEYEEKALIPEEDQSSPPPETVGGEDDLTGMSMYGNNGSKKKFKKRRNY